MAHGPLKGNCSIEVENQLILDDFKIDIYEHFCNSLHLEAFGTKNLSNNLPRFSVTICFKGGL